MLKKNVNNQLKSEKIKKGNPIIRFSKINQFNNK